MTHIEAMKYWLDAMETELAVDFMDAVAVGEAAENLCGAIASLRQAIAEAEKEAEKVEYAYTCAGCDYLSWANNFSCECQSPPLMKFKRVKVIR